ncbi:11703_t:CDS:2, partial [Funneliformis geosporum]
SLYLYHQSSINTKTANPNHPFMSHFQEHFTHEIRDFYGDYLEQNLISQQDKDEYFQNFLTKEKSNVSMKLSNEKEEKKKPQWTEDKIKRLLSFLKGRKHVLKQLKEHRGGSGNAKTELWIDASNELSNIFNPKQCEIKWKNIKQTNKLQPNYQFKKDVEAILFP